MMFSSMMGTESVECGNCEWEGRVSAAEPIDDFFERVGPGEECPAGECPECGALVHLTPETVVDPDAPDWAEVAKIAFGETPTDGLLMTGRQMQRFAKKAISNMLKTPTLLKRYAQALEPPPTPTPMTREQIVERIRELDEKIRAYPGWGAALTAMDEERCALQRNLDTPNEG